MRHQAPLRTVQMGPIEPLPVTGCVTSDSEYPWVDGDPAVEAAEDAALDAASAEKAAAAPSAQAPAPAQNPPSTSEGRVTTSPKPIIQVPPLPASNHANGNGKPHHNGHTSGNGAYNSNGKPEHNGHVNRPPDGNGAPASTVQRFNDSTASAPSSVVQNPETKTEQNRTKREGGPKSGPSASTTSENQK